VPKGEYPIRVIVVATNTPEITDGIKAARRVSGRALLPRRTTNTCPGRAGKYARANIQPAAMPTSPATAIPPPIARTDRRARYSSIPAVIQPVSKEHCIERVLRGITMSPGRRGVGGWLMVCELTVKLSGRAEAPAHGAEGAQFLSARGAKQEAPHGTLQRLLDANT